MRRLALICVCFLFLLTGCGKKTVKVESEGFSCNVSACWQGNHYAFFLEAPGGGIYRATLTEGALKNMVFTLDGDKASVEYLGMDYNLPEGFFGQSCVMAFRETLLALKRGGEEVSVGADNKINLDTKLGGAEITLRPDGFPKQIILPEKDAQLEFSDFNYLN